MNVTDKFQQYMNNRALSRVEIGEGRSLSLGFGDNNNRTFFKSYLRDYKEIELGTYGQNWRVRTNSLHLTGDDLSVSEDYFYALIGELASVQLLNDSVALIFPSGQIDFLYNDDDDDEDFHLFTPSRDCWEWKDRIWTLYRKHY